MEKEYKETQSPDDRLQEKPDWQAIIRQARRDGWMVCYHPFYGWLLEKYVGPGPKVVVPGWIASLCEGAFGNRGDLTGITLQGRLKFIDSYAFSGCTGLTSVTIPKSVSEIRCDAFYNCTSLAEIKVDPENKYYRAVDGLLLELRREWKGEEEDGNEDFNGPAGMKTGAFEEEEGSEDSPVGGDITSQMYEEDAFALSSIIPRGYGEEDWENGDWEGCETYWVLHSCPLGKEGPLAIPEGIRGICESAFSGCTGLTRVTIPEGVLEIGKAAFCRCTSLAGAVLPKSVCRIGPSAFLGCANLAHIEIPEGNTFISPFAFSGCTGLAGVVLPKGIIQICEGAFKDCIGLTGVTFPQSVILIEKSAFYGCTGLTDAVIPEGVIKIGREAFSGCTSLRTAIPETGGNDLPEGNEFDEGYYCFTDEFHVDEEDEFWEHGFDLLEDFLYEDETSDCSRDEDGMGSEDCWSQNDMAADILKGAAEIKPRAFAGWIELRKADIPEGVTKIGDGAFWNCWRLDRVVIPKSVTAIGQRAFRGCTSLAQVELPEGIQEISSQTFKNCTSLSHIAIPESVRAIRKGAFEGCKRLSHVTIPEGVRVINSEAFRNCTALCRVDIPKSVRAIFDNTFEGCPGLIIHAPAGSYAEEYAGCLGIRFSSGEEQTLKLMPGTGQGCVNTENRRVLLTLEERLKCAAESRASSPEAAIRMVQKFSEIPAGRFFCGEGDLDAMNEQTGKFWDHPTVDVNTYHGFCQTFRLAINYDTACRMRRQPEMMFPAEDSYNPCQPIWSAGTVNAVILLGLMLLDHAKGRVKNKDIHHCMRMTLGQYLDALTEFTSGKEGKTESFRTDFRLPAQDLLKSHDGSRPLGEALADILRRYIAARQEFGRLNHILCCMDALACCLKEQGGMQAESARRFRAVLGRYCPGLEGRKLMEESKGVPDPYEHYLTLAGGYREDVPDPGSEGLAPGTVRSQVFLPEYDFSPQSLRALAAQTPFRDFGELLEKNIREEQMARAMKEINASAVYLYTLWVEPYLPADPLSPYRILRDAAGTDCIPDFKERRGME